MTGYLRGMALGAAVALAIGCTGCGDKDKKEEKPAAGGGETKPAAGGGGGGSGKAYDAAKSTASVKFTVKWAGAKPPSQDVMIAGDDICKAAHPTPMKNEQFLLNDDGTMPNAFVWASKGPHEGMTGFPAGSAFNLDQKGCTYVPHVFGIRAGQQFTITNSDGTKHNVHTHAKRNSDINIPQDKDAKNDHVFDKQEKAIPFQCDVHSWMKAWGFVVDHPFYGTSDSKGTVTISGLPAGAYTFKVWHEQYSGDAPYEQDVTVTLKDGESATKEVTFK